MSSKNYAALGVSFLLLTFFVFNCEKEVIQVPTEELYNPNANYEGSEIDTLFQIDSLVIFECPGPDGWSEYPDVVFSFTYDFLGEEDTSDLVFYDVQQSNLPITFIPTNPIIYVGDLYYFGNLTIGAHEMDLPGDYWFDMANFSVDLGALARINQVETRDRITLKDFHISMHLYYHFQ